MTKNFKKSWEDDLWLAIGEQDVLKLKGQLKMIRNSKNENSRNYSRNELIENK